jgi:hypothetical protein
MHWNGGLYPVDTRDPRFDSMNSKIYEQYKTYSNKSVALLGCLNDPNCPSVFDEKCDGIGPFVIGFRAKRNLTVSNQERKGDEKRTMQC